MKFYKFLPGIAVLISVFIYSFLILNSKTSSARFGDFGLMYIQTQDILKYNYKSIVFHYPGKAIDPDYEFSPFKKPFFGKFQSKPYIDFPPYFPFFSAPFLSIFGMKGLYIPGLLAFIFSLFIIIKLSELLELGAGLGALSVILFSFGNTSSLYLLVFHETSISILCITLSFYFIAKNSKGFKFVNFFYSGLFGALSLVFRLELIFVFMGLSIGEAIRVYFTENKDLNKIIKMAIYASLGFVPVFILLLISNQILHGHPLGLRYVLTITDNPTPALSGRIAIISDMLFSYTRGMFYQSPFFIFSIFSFPLLLRFQKKSFLFGFTFLFSFFLILATSPNHGDHRAPRYLFGIYSFGIVLSIFMMKDFMSRIKNKNFRNIYIIFISILVVFSIRGTIREFHWTEKAAKEIIKLNQIILSQPEDVIIFRHYGIPLNTQDSFYKKIFFVAEENERLQKLTNNLLNSKISKFAIMGIGSESLVTELSPIQNNSDKLMQFAIKYGVLPEIISGIEISKIDIFDKFFFIHLFIKTSPQD